MPGSTALPELTPWKIASVYGFFGLIWIAASDAILLFFVSSQETITAIQTVKGAAFVAISAVLIWGLTSRREAQISESHERLEVANQRLAVLQRIFRHNIRNDLNVVKGFIELAREKTESRRVRQALRTASTTTDDVLDISDKLRVLDKYGAQDVVRDTIDLRTVIDEAVAEFRKSYPMVDIDIDAPESVRIVGDGSVEYVIDELLENAAQHYDGPLEALSISVTVRKEDGSAAVTVEDNGPGIPTGELDALLEGAESKLIHLSSVGFWLVYWLTDRVDADIDIDTVDADGTTITIRFQTPGIGSNVWLSRSPNVVTVDVPGSVLDSG